MDEMTRGVERRRRKAGRREEDRWTWVLVVAAWLVGTACGIRLEQWTSGG